MYKNQLEEIKKLHDEANSIAYSGSIDNREKINEIVLGLFNEEHTDWLIKQAEKAQRYEKALMFYANEENYEAWSEYEDATSYFNNVDFDSGDTARNALENK